MLLSIVVSAVSHTGAAALFGQTRQQQPGQAEDVVRVSTDLVQTDVMVFRKDGGFADGLKREQFELKINGKPREISFFERIAAGSRNEEAQLAAARGVSVPGGSDVRAIPLDRGRAVFFFLDDLHLSVASVAQARALLIRFIDHEMGQNDEAAITSASGQIGFLQQLTNNKTVLHAAVERLKVRPYSVLDNERPAMSEYQAELIEANDTDVLGYFVESLIRDGVPPNVAANLVHARARQILAQAGNLTTASLASLESLARSSAQLPGRKLIFLISDGFFLNSLNSDTLDRIRKITLAAARAGVVIYSIDARGLVAPMADASTPGDFDPSGRLQRASSRELSASQDGLNALARDTGGRPFFNTNALSGAITTALQETSIYYLVAWRPENDEERSGNIRRIEVNIVQHPELTVRMRRRLAQTEVTTSKDRKGEQPPKPQTNQLRSALLSAYQKTDLPTSVEVNFMNLADQGSVLAMTLQAATDGSAFSIVDGKQTAVVGVAGVVFDDAGKTVGGFQERVTIKANSAEVRLPANNNLFYNYRVQLKPGLYQVRVAAYDEKTKRAGSATEWIEVPDLSSRRLALSSVLVGERVDASGPPNGSVDPAANQGTNIPGVVRSSIDRRFGRASHLRFLVFTYNAANSPGAGGSATVAPDAGPDVAIQVLVLRDGEPVVTTTLRKIETQGTADLGRLPYSAEIPMQELPAGRYLLKVTVIDRIAKTSASQQLAFRVD
jgi:VWFA-related protein